MISSSTATILTYPSNVADSVFDLDKLNVISKACPPVPPPIRIWVTDIAKHFFRRPRSKKKRIIWKWKKREENYIPTSYRINNPTETIIVIHPDLYNKLLCSPHLHEPLRNRPTHSSTQASPLAD